MSIKLMTRIWDECTQNGPHLLALLALADWASDEGIAFPSIAKLAQRCRLKPRRVQSLIKDLENSGELFIKRGNGRRGSRYLVTAGSDQSMLAKVLVAEFSMKLPVAESTAIRIVNQRERCKKLHLRGAENDTSGVQEIAPQGCNIWSNDKANSKTPSNRRRSDPSIEPSIEPSLDSLAAANATASEKTQQEIADPSKKTEEKKPQAHISLIDAWHNALPEDVRPISPNYSRNVKVAKDLLNAGITPDQVIAFVKANYASYRDWAKQRKIPAIMALEHVRTYIKDWLSRQQIDKPMSEWTAEDWTKPASFKWDFGGKS